MAVQQGGCEIRDLLVQIAGMTELLLDEEYLYGSESDEKKLAGLYLCLKRQLETVTSVDLSCELAYDKFGRALSDADMFILIRALEEADVSKLERLDFSDNWLRTDSVVALARLLESGRFVSLRRLNLFVSDLEAAGCEAIARALRTGNLAGLHQLVLPSCDVDVIAEAIEIGRVWNLQHLTLFGDENGVAESVSLSRLFEAGRLSSLKHLTLAYCKLSGNGMASIAEAILSGKVSSGLEHLTVSNCSMGNKGGIMLGAAVKAGYLSRLKQLCIYSCEIDVEGMLAIAEGVQACPLSSLTHLDFSFNTIGDKGAVAFAAVIQQGHFPMLESLHLDGCGILAVGVETLAATIEAPGKFLAYDFNSLQTSPRFCKDKLGDRLKELGLNCNQFGQRGAVALARTLRNGHLPYLSKLGLRNCGLGSGGLLHLVEALVTGSMVELQSLDLSLNSAGYTESYPTMNNVSMMLSNGAFPNLVFCSYV